jgi:hypothetical protein
VYEKRSAALINYYTLGKKPQAAERGSNFLRGQPRIGQERVLPIRYRNLGMRAFLCDFLRSDQQVRIPNNTENGIETTGHGLM